MKMLKRIPYKYMVKLIKTEIKFLSWYTDRFNITENPEDKNTLIYKSSSLPNKQQGFLNEGYILISKNGCRFKYENTDIDVKFINPLDFVPNNCVIVSNKPSYLKIKNLYTLILKMESNGLDLRLIDFSIYKSATNLANVYISHRLDKTIVISAICDADTNITKYKQKIFNSNNNMLNSMMTTMMNNIILDI